MKPIVLIPSLLAGGSALTTSIAFSQTSSYDPMSIFIEYPEDKRTTKESIEKISELIAKVKEAFESLKKKIENYERGFKGYEKMSKDKAKMKSPGAKELARINFLAKNLKSLLEKEGLSDSEKEKLQAQKTSLEAKIKKIETEGKDYSNSKDVKIKDVSKSAGEFFEKIQALYEELFLFFEQYGGLISKNIGINRKKSLSALLSTAEKVGLLEGKENTNYISGGLKFTKTIDTSDKELISEIKKNYFTIDEGNSTVVLKTMNKKIWDFFDWNNDGKNDLSDWNSWITKNR